MATATSSSSTPTPPPTAARTSTHRNLNLRNPLPLSASQEQEVRNIYYRRVRDHCAAEIKDFAACALNRTFTVSFACRKQRFAMNSCMISHATREEEDLAREEWFVGRDDRQRQRRETEEAVERRREEVIRTQRGWEEKEMLRLKQGKKEGGEKDEEMRVGRDGRWIAGYGDGQTQERGRTWR